MGRPSFYCFGVLRNLTDVTRSMWEGRCDDSTCPRWRYVSHLIYHCYTAIGRKPLPHVFSVAQYIGFKQCCSELFIVNLASVQLFSQHCSFLFTPEHLFQGICLWIKHLPRLA